MNPVGSSTEPLDTGGRDRALAVIVPQAYAEQVGAVLMEAFGSFQEVPLPASHAADGEADARVRLVFYPDTAGERSGGRLVEIDKSVDAREAGETVDADEVVRFPSCQDVLALLPEEMRGPGVVEVETAEVERDWVDGWKDHFQPILIGGVRVRPPWEPALETSVDGSAEGPVEVVINPGLGFGTGLHPTTRGTLRLLQDEPPGGPLVDVGTGSGVLAIAAAKSGWAPVVAFDNDPVALISARENVEANGVATVVTVLQAGVEELMPEWSREATVLANMTLEPVLTLLGRLKAAGPQGRPRRLVVSGILAGAQERQLLRAATEAGFIPGRRVYETEWVSLVLVPAASGRTARD